MHSEYVTTEFMACRTDINNKVLISLITIIIYPNLGLLSVLFTTLAVVWKLNTNVVDKLDKKDSKSDQ